MAEPLRLLLVEEPIGTDRVLHELRRGGYEPACTRVDTWEGLRAALEGGAWDAVIAAATAPGLDARDALALIRQRDPDLPVVVVSATSLQAAVAAMRAGAADCLAADDLPRLATAVRHAVREARERNQAEGSLRGSEARYRRLVEAAQEGIWEVDAQDRTTFVSPAMASLLGYTAAEMLRRPLGAFVDDSGHPMANLGMARRRQGKTGQGDVPFRRKDGSVLWARVTATPLFDGAGRYSGALAMLADITAHKRAEEALRRSERHFRALIEHSFDAIALLDAEGRIGYASPSMQGFLGHDEHEIRGVEAFSFVHPDDLPDARAALAALLARPNGAARAVYRMRYGAGGYRWVEVRATNLLHDPDIGALVLNVLNVNEQRQADEMRQRLAAIVETSADAIFSLSLDGAIESWNEGAVRLFGYSREEAMGAHFSLLARPEQREEQQRLIVAARQGTMQVADHQAVWRRRDGHPIDVAITLAPLLGHGDRVTAISAVVHDITARARAQEEEERARAAAEELARLRAEREWEARAVAEVGAALAHELDPERLYRLILEHAARLLPCDHAHMRLYQDGWVVVAAAWGNTTAAIGARLFPLTDAAGRWMPIARDAVVRVDDSAQIPYWVEVPPYIGERRAGSSLIVPIVIDGEAVGSLTINNRRTHAYADHHLRLAAALGDHLTLALRNARLYAREQERARAAEELVRVRNDFVAAVSHELRTPLTAVVGYSELLQARWSQLTEERRQLWLAHVVAAGNRQRHLVDDLLTLTRVESGTLVLACADLPLRPLVEQAVAEVEGIYLGQRIELDGPPDLRAFADPERIVQILAHLLDNAAKYSPEGTPITVAWRAEERMAALHVRDRGPGIGESSRGQLFTRFGRLPGSRMRAGRVGTGLGLHLGRQLARTMGGDLDLEETGPEGSTFRICLPQAPPAT